MSSLKEKSYLKLFIFIIFVSIVAIFYNYGGSEYLDLSFLQGKLSEIQNYTDRYPYKSFFFYFTIYVLSTALSFPGATALTLLAGAIFGLWPVLLLASFGSSIGSLLAFLASRFLLRDFFIKKFQRQFRTIDSNIKKDGIVYLATLRLIPIFPFFVINIQLNENGSVAVNPHMQTNIPNIYACGDVAGPFQLTHMSAHQAWYCAVNSLFPIKLKVDYSAVPWCTYTDPEIATVGETEMSAKAKNLEYEVTEYDLSDLDRAITENEKHGVVRVITQKGKEKFLGATIVGS